MGIESQYIWMDGKMVPYKDANVHVLAHTLHYGLGVFEGIRSYQQPGGGGGVFKLDEHLRRLYDSARMCRMKMPVPIDELREDCLETLRVNEFEEAYIRPIAFLGRRDGAGRSNQSSTCSRRHLGLGAYLGEEGLVMAFVPRPAVTRHHVNANLQRAKIIGHYGIPSWLI